jgi:Lar family restriction alleviation protein
MGNARFFCTTTKPEARKLQMPHPKATEPLCQKQSVVEGRTDRPGAEESGVEGTLLPCPFCGNEAVRGRRKDESLWSHDIVDWHYIECQHCDISMEQCDDFNELVQSWNTRAGQVADTSVSASGE